MCPAHFPLQRYNFVRLMPTQSARPRFGAPLNRDATEALEQLKSQVPQGDAFWSGRVYLKDCDGKPVAARIEPTQPQDARQVDSWYDPQPDGGPYYHIPKWREWWNKKIQASALPNNPEKTLKLTVGDNRMLGVVHFIKHFPNPFGPGLITKADGIRIAPACVKIDPTDQTIANAKPLYTGVGSALVTQVVVENLINGDRGFGGNATMGAEGFYHKLRFQHRPAQDGKRTYFFTEPQDHLPFLSRQFAKYQTLHDQAQAHKQQRNGQAS